MIPGSTELRQLLAACDNLTLSTWEAELVASLRIRRRPPTEKQMVVLRRIVSGAPDYETIAAAGLHALPEILSRWLPDGKLTGHEYAARNPRRADRHPGSFTVNTATGQWADFATGDRGGDVISLAALLFGLSQPEAARRVGGMLGFSMEAERG